MASHIAQDIMSRKSKPATAINDRTQTSSRAGTRIISLHVAEDVFRAFKILAAENLATTDIMGHKAVGLLFQHFGKQLPESLNKKLRMHGLEGVASVSAEGRPKRPSHKQRVDLAPR